MVGFGRKSLQMNTMMFLFFSSSVICPKRSGFPEIGSKMAEKWEKSVKIMGFEPLIEIG